MWLSSSWRKWHDVYCSSADYNGGKLTQEQDFEIRLSMKGYIEDRLRLKPVNHPKKKNCLWNFGASLYSQNVCLSP